MPTMMYEELRSVNTKRFVDLAGSNATVGGKTIDNSIFVNNTAQNPGAPMQCQVNASGANNLQFPPTT